MSLQRQITNLLTKWKAIPIQTLVDEIDPTRYKSISNTIARLRNSGLLEVKRFSRYGRYKYISPTQKLLDENGMNDILITGRYQSERDAFISYLCIKLESYANVNETLIEDYLLGTELFNSHGIHYPSALMKLTDSKGIYDIPIEFLVGPSRISNIKDKYERYLFASNFHDIIFCCISKSTAEFYHRVFIDIQRSLKDPLEKDIYFVYISTPDFFKNDLKDFKVLNSKTYSNLDEMIAGIN